MTGIDAKAGEAAKQLEAYFLRQVLSTMPKGTMFGGDGASASTLHGMFTEVLADAMSEGQGTGLGAQLREALEGAQPRGLPLPTAETNPETVVDEITSSRAREIPSSLESIENGVER